MDTAANLYFGYTLKNLSIQTSSNAFSTNIRDLLDCGQEIGHRPTNSKGDFIIFTPFSPELLLILPAIHSHSFSATFFQRRGRRAQSRYSTDLLDSQNESTGREDENDYDSSCGSLHGEPVGHKNGATDFYNTPLMIAASHRFPCSL